VITINAAAGNETYQLPGAYAPGRTVTVRREDSSGNTVTITLASGQSLDGVTDATATIPGNSTAMFEPAQIGVWESYGLGGGGGGAVSSVSGRTGVVTTNQLATDLGATFGPGSDQWLKRGAAAFSFGFTSITTTDTITGLPTAAAVKWEDATVGAFTGTIDAGGNGYSGYVVTWVGSPTKTVTVTGITYDANGVALGPTGLAVA
jgi:hypothetical protein